MDKENYSRSDDVEEELDNRQSRPTRKIWRNNTRE